MATTKKQKINFYMKHATQNLILAMDDHSLFCKVISETVEGISYRVEMDESTMTATSCSCPATGACKHLEIANSLQYKVAPVEETPVAEETTIFEVERKSFYIVDHKHQVWCQDGTWMCAEGAEWVALVMAHLGLEQPAEVVPPIAMDLPAELRGYRKRAVSTDTSVLNGAVQSAGVLMALPSRRAYVSSMQEKQSHKSNLLAEMREIRERRAI